MLQMLKLSCTVYNALSTFKLGSELFLKNCDGVVLRTNYQTLLSCVLRIVSKNHRRTLINYQIQRFDKKEWNSASIDLFKPYCSNDIIMRLTKTKHRRMFDFINILHKTVLIVVSNRHRI